ncbi:MAG: hypothetical protein WBZ31_00415, partial [Thiobacillus sp.]
PAENANTDALAAQFRNLGLTPPAIVRLFQSINSQAPVFLAAADKVCTECKRQGYPCVMVSRGVACMGPVTRAGCGALCPSLGRDCYGCYGPAENANADALAAQFRSLGLTPPAIVQRFQSINSQAPVFLAAADQTRASGHD